MKVVVLNEQAGRQGSADLADRITAVLKGDGVTSDEVSSLIAETERASATAVALAGATKENSLDPRLSAADAKRARETALEAEWQNERLTTALASLKQKLAEAKADEAEANRKRDYDAAVIERDRIAEEMREFFPEAERRLAKLLPALEANNRELARINTSAMPKDGQHLKSAELVARGLESWKIGRDGINSVTSIAAELCWVRWEANPHDPLVWPTKIPW